MIHIVMHGKGHLPVGPIHGAGGRINKVRWLYPTASFKQIQKSS